VSAALVVACAAGCAHAPEPEPRPIPTLGSALAALPDRSLNFDLVPKAQLHGRVVMVSFISTWCFPCMADLPVMKKLQDDLGPKGYATIAVGMDLEGPKVLRPFAASYELPYPLVWASDEVRAGATVFGKVTELPTRFLFGRDGKLVMAFSGVADPEQLMAEVAKVVER
jgi:thiol-disulfide isomerase/thioredoxin